MGVDEATKDGNIYTLRGQNTSKGEFKEASRYNPITVDTYKDLMLIIHLNDFYGEDIKDMVIWMSQAEDLCIIDH